GDAGEHGPSGKWIRNQETRRQEYTELALRPADKLNESTGYRPRQELPGDIGRGARLDGCDIDPVNGGQEPLREISRMGEPHRRNSDQEREHCCIELLASAFQFEPFAAAEAAQDVTGFEIVSHVGKCRPVAALKPTRRPSAIGGNPIRMPMISVISATAKAGNQPECIAAMPTSSSWMKAAKAA